MAFITPGETRVFTTTGRNYIVPRGTSDDNAWVIRNRQQRIDFPYLTFFPGQKPVGVVLYARMAGDGIISPNEALFYAKVGTDVQSQFGYTMIEVDRLRVDDSRFLPNTNSDFADEDQVSNILIRDCDFVALQLVKRSGLPEDSPLLDYFMTRPNEAVQTNRFHCYERPRFI